jgi:hypothetical protein
MDTCQYIKKMLMDTCQFMKHANGHVLMHENIFLVGGENPANGSLEPWTMHMFTCTHET